MIRAKYRDPILFKKAAAACYELAHLGVLIDLDPVAQEITLRGGYDITRKEVEKWKGILL